MSNLEFVASEGSGWFAKNSWPLHNCWTQNQTKNLCFSCYFLGFFLIFATGQAQNVSYCTVVELYILKTLIFCLDCFINMILWSFECKASRHGSSAGSLAATQLLVWSWARVTVCVKFHIFLLFIWVSCDHCIYEWTIWCIWLPLCDSEA